MTKIPLPLKEVLIYYKQELQYTLRAQHALVEDSEAFDEDVVMGMLHVERRLIKKLNDIIGSL